MEPTKCCIKCNAVKAESEFTQYRANHTKNICKLCSMLNRQQADGASYRSFLNGLCLKARSARRNAPFPFAIDTDHLCELWERQNGKCALSGVHMTHHRDGSGRKDFNASMDRVIPDLGYVPGNVQLVCDRVNTMRHTLSMDMFYWWVKCIHEQSCD